jgi:NarL family two-component system response regulator LiaR
MKSIRIMVADDHALVREGIKELLEREKDMVVVGEASDGDEAIRLADTLNPDIILMDIAMPKIDGIEATKRIKADYPNITVLVLTAYDNEEFVIAILNAGAAGYLLKTVRGDELLRAIRAVNAGESVLHPAVTKAVLQRLQSVEPQPKNTKEPLLTARELQVVSLGAQGLVNKEIAAKLSVSDRTVQSHWRNIFVKLAVGSRIEAILYCVKNELA